MPSSCQKRRSTPQKQPIPKITDFDSFGKLNISVFKTSWRNAIGPTFGSLVDWTSDIASRNYGPLRLDTLECNTDFFNPKPDLEGRRGFRFKVFWSGNSIIDGTLSIAAEIKSKAQISQSSSSENSSTISVLAFSSSRIVPSEPWWSFCFLLNWRLCFGVFGGPEAYLPSVR